MISRRSTLVGRPGPAGRSSSDSSTVHCSSVRSVGYGLRSMVTSLAPSSGVGSRLRGSSCYHSACDFPTPSQQFARITREQRRELLRAMTAYAKEARPDLSSEEIDRLVDTMRQRIDEG